MGAKDREKRRARESGSPDCAAMIAGDVIDHLDQRAEGLNAKSYRRALQLIVNKLLDRLGGVKAKG